jgi:hypothetical protein
MENEFMFMELQGIPPVPEKERILDKRGMAVYMNSRMFPEQLMGIYK